MSQIILNSIEPILQELYGKKIFLVKSNSFNHLKIKNEFEMFDCVEFIDITPNPLYEQVCKGVEAFNNQQCDVIVAVGGGSVIDVAKCIKLFCKMNPSINYLKQELYDTEVPIVAIPTTLGTGS